MDTYHWDDLVRTTETSLGVSFKTCLRRRGDVMMGRHCYVLLRRRYDVPIRRRRDAPLRRLGDVLSRRCWVFLLRRTCNVAGMYRETSLQRPHDVLMPGGLWANFSIGQFSPDSCFNTIVQFGPNFGKKLWNLMSQTIMSHDSLFKNFGM